MMKAQKSLSLLIALLILLSCIGWTPTHVQAEEVTLEKNP